MTRSIVALFGHARYSLRIIPRLLSGDGEEVAENQGKQEEEEERRSNTEEHLSENLLALNEAVYLSELIVMNIRKYLYVCILTFSVFICLFICVCLLFH